MSRRAARLQPWLWVLCGIAVVAAVVLAGPYVFAESARAARPLGGVALRSLVWIVIACAAYAALAPGRASSRARP